MNKRENNPPIIPSYSLSLSLSSAFFKLCSRVNFGSLIHNENAISGTVKQMPVMHRILCVCMYPKTTASRSGVPTAFASAKVNGSAYTSAARVALPSVFVSSGTSVWDQIAPAMELPRAEPMLYEERKRAVTMARSA